MIPSFVRTFFTRASKLAQLIRQPSWMRKALTISGMTSPQEVHKLYELAKDVEDGCIVEVGSYRGRSTSALASGVKDSGSDVPIYAIDPHEKFQGELGGEFGPNDRAAFFRSMLRSEAYEFVRLVNLSSEVVGPGWDKPVSLLWLDGDHTYEGVKRDLGCWKPHLSPEAIVVFDDATNPELGPYKLIDEISNGDEFESMGQVGKMRIMKYCA